jgi:transposase
MIYIGMDVSSKEFVIHAIDQRQQKVFEGRIAPSRAGLRKLVNDLGVGPKLFVFEAGNQMKWIALTLMKQEGVRIHVVHPNEIKWINQSSGKTDKVDARKMAQLARGNLLPRAVHVVEGKARQLRELVSARGQLQSKRVALINTVRGYMKQEGVSLPEKFFQRTDWKSSLGEKSLGDTQKLIVKSFMDGIDGLECAEKEITAKMTEIRDDRCDLLETIPAIGKIASRVLVGALDDASRFDNKKCVANYGGLAPTIYQSGDVTNLGRINRDGRQEIRKVLLQCAHTIQRMVSHDAAPIREFFERIEKRRGKKRAVVATARKLLTIAYGVLKSGTPYDPMRLRAFA